MKLLLINTCGADNTVALAEDGSIVASATLPARGTSEHLMPAIRSLFAASPARPDAVAVVNGPGSFTGVRVGLSAAKGLCEAWAVPMIAISRLALLATALESENEVVALLDAGRGEYYCGVYRGRIKLKEELLRLEEVLILLNKWPGITCEQRVVASLGQTIRLIDEPGPRTILAMALDRIAADDWSDVALTDANYLRRTDAELLAKQA
jgi:tRNA threonylcarbamoyladenosine biosynthesis protein TsaB